MILQALVYEFDFDDPRETDRKIKRRLRYRKSGPFSQERVDLLRRLKNSIQDEIHLDDRSKYFRGGQGRFSVSETFDVPRLIEHCHKQFPSITLDDVVWFVRFAIYNHEMR